MVNISIGRLKHGKTWRFGIRIHDNHCDNQAFLRRFTKNKTIINLINLLQDEMRWHRLREGAPGGGYLRHNGFNHHPFSWVSSISHLCFHLYLYHDICVCVCNWHNHYVYLYLFWLCYWIISQKSWWPTFNITKWCEARDDFDYEMISIIDFVSGTWFWSWFLLDFAFVSGTSPTRCYWCWFPVLSTRWWSALSRCYNNHDCHDHIWQWTWSRSRIVMMIMIRYDNDDDHDQI